MCSAPAGVMSPQTFVAKWARTELTERAASQEHSLDLCHLLGQPTPAEHDPRGIDYAFEKGTSAAGPASAGTKGERGFADVWWRGKFALEYKRKGVHRTLTDAYRQLCQYREALENPPLLIVSDIERIEIHTNFTGCAKVVHEVRLGAIGEPKSIDLLRRVFEDPGSFKPTITAEKITEEVAARFGALAEIDQRVLANLLRMNHARAGVAPAPAKRMEASKDGATKATQDGAIIDRAKKTGLSTRRAARQ